MQLDHLFFGLPAIQFDEKLGQFPVSKFVNHQKVVTTDDNWEGLYIYCKNKTYFEYLRERRNHKFGIAIQSQTPIEAGPPAEVRSNSNLSWKHGTRYSENGKFWFNWFAMESTRDLEIPFVFWIMQYDESYLNRLSTMLPLKSPYSSIESIQIEASFGLRNRFKYNSQFFSEIVSEDLNSTAINFPDTQIHIQWMDLIDKNPIELIELKFKRNESLG